MKIPFNKTVVLENHIDGFEEALRSGKISSGGHFGIRCEQELNRLNGSENLLVPSATAALEMMAILLEISPGDEVIIPSFTFVSTANAFALRGAQIRFAESDSTGNIIPEEIERLSNSKTKAVCAVHYGGNSANMDKITEICQQKDLILLEDAAQCIFSSFKDKSLGSFGSMGCYSFHDTKNISAGEGGALILNDPRFSDRAYIIRDKGTNRRAFIQGQVDKYSWVDLGSSYCLSELNAAYLQPQLDSGKSITAKRGFVWQTYESELREVFEKHSCSIIYPPSYNTPNYHMFALLTKSTDQRSEILKRLSGLGVQATFHYVPLHLSKFGKRFSKEALPQCEDFASRILRLPLWYNMTEEDISYVIESVKNVFN